jgi:integrase
VTADKIIQLMLVAAPGDGDVETSRVRPIGANFASDLIDLLGLQSPYTITYWDAKQGSENTIGLDGVDATKQILSRQELARVLADLTSRATRLANVRMNLVIVRLACCCGLRAREIGGLRLTDVLVGIPRPHLQARAEFAKLCRPRRVPLWWDAGTLDDLVAWKLFRQAQGAKADDPFVCSLQRATLSRPLNRHVLRRRFLTACRVVGHERLRTLTIHHGRHTFISHALAGGRTLAEVRSAAGHASLLTTSVYLHVAVDDDGEVGKLFEFGR